MPNVTVAPIKTINVRVNQSSQKTVSSTAQFTGAPDVEKEVEQLKILSQNAYNTANLAFGIANTSLQTSGGIITGSLEIKQNLTVDEIIIANNEIIDAGIF
jgi:hypothetical protein